MSIVMNDLTKAFGDPPTNVLKGISGEIQNGEMVSIVGRSGSGKSTLLYLISSLDKPSSGDVIFDKVSFAKMTVKELHFFRNKKMGFVFQFHHLLPELSALENILMPSLKFGSRASELNFALELLNEFGILDKKDSRPSQLSGGEQQRVAIARALIMKPQVLFADEPTGNLDSVNGLLVMNLFKKINQNFKTTIVYVTHDHVFSQMASRQIYLSDGKIVDQTIN